MDPSATPLVAPAPDDPRPAAADPAPAARGALARAAPFGALAAVALAAYASSFTVPFVFDDHFAILQATKVHAVEVSPRALAPSLEGFPAGRWLAYVTFALNHAVGGTDPAGYHVVNLVFHVGAAILVLLLAREILRRVGGLEPGAQRRAALVTALVFAAHPVQTMAVTYVVQRMTSMGAFFALLALLLFVRGRAAQGRGRALRLGAGAASAYLAFACKETFAVLPVFAVLLEALLFPGLVARLRRNPRLVAAAAGVLVALGALAAWRYAGTIATEQVRYPLTTGERLLTQPRVLWHYLSLLVLPLPSRLHIDYFWTKSAGLLDPPTTLAALAALAGLVAAAVALRRRAVLFSLAVAWFLGGLLVEQTVLPIDLVFEHRLYLPSLGWFLLAAWALERAVRSRPPAVWLVAAPAIALLAAGTSVRNATWNDPIALYSDPAGYGPGAARNLVTLGRELFERGRVDEAAQALTRASELEPANPGPLVTLATIQQGRGAPEVAIATYRRALAMNPGIPQAWFGLANTLLRAGRVAEAEEASQAGLAREPGFGALRVLLSACAERRGDLAGARGHLEEALRRDPGLWVAWANLAEVFLAEGRGPDALAAAQRFVGARPNDPKGQALLGRALAAVGRRAEARAALERALRVTPGDAGARRALAALGQP